MWGDINVDKLSLWCFEFVLLFIESNLMLSFIVLISLTIICFHLICLFIVLNIVDYYLFLSYMFICLNIVTTVFIPFKWVSCSRWLCILMAKAVKTVVYLETDCGINVEIIVQVQSNWGLCGVLWLKIDVIYCNLVGLFAVIWWHCLEQLGSDSEYCF